MTVEPFLELTQYGEVSVDRQRCLNPLWPRFKSEEIELTMTGQAGEPGSASFVLATITGTVEVAIITVCTENLSFDLSSAQLSLGTDTNNNAFISSTVSKNIDINEIWHDTSPDSSVEESTVVKKKIVNEDIKLYGTVQSTSGGKLKFFVYWNPLTIDGNLVLNS